MYVNKVPYFVVEVLELKMYIKKSMFVEVGNSETSKVLKLFLALVCYWKAYWAFAPDTVETRKMLKVLSLQFPLLKLVVRIYKAELKIETLIQSREYGTHDCIMNITYPKIKGTIIFHE